MMKTVFHRYISAVFSNLHLNHGKHLDDMTHSLWHIFTVHSGRSVTVRSHQQNRSVFCHQPIGWSDFVLMHLQSPGHADHAETQIYASARPDWQTAEAETEKSV